MSADLQDLFDQAGWNAPASTLDVDTVLRRARRSRDRRRATRAIVALVAVTVVVVVGAASQRRPAADPVPAGPAPTVQTLGKLGRLAYGIDGDIYVADADGKNPVRIADGAPSEPGDCGGYWGEGSLWSPDGRFLAYRGDGGEGEPSCDRTVNISDPAGRRLASFPGEGWAIAWSPDSTRVAVWEDFYGKGTLEIYGLDGVRQAALSMPQGWTASGDVDPVWSPDGRSLLVPRGPVIPVDGSTPRRLDAADPRQQWMVTHSPNGAEIAYISPEGLAVAAADGSGARVLVRGALNEDFPIGMRLEWSPTGDRIAFEHRSGGSTAADNASELALLDVASGAVLSLAEMGGASTFDSIKFSPAGDQVLFSRTDTAGASSLWSVHADGSGLRRLVAGTGWGDWQRLG